MLYGNYMRAQIGEVGGLSTGSVMTLTAGQHVKQS